VRAGECTNLEGTGLPHEFFGGPADCSLYDGTPEYCGSYYYDDDDFTRTVNCCTCGGGVAPSAPPTKSPTASPTASLTAKGDPHLQNMLGQRFDLMVPGVHTLINIPRGTPEKNSKLFIAADAQRMQKEASCGDLYFQSLNVTGEWLHGRGPLLFRAGHMHQNDEAKWMKFDKVDVKVVHGVTLTGIAYLNLMIRNLKAIGFAVGGLLGEDSHELQATPSPMCRRTVSLLQVEHAPTNHWLALAE